MSYCRWSSDNWKSDVYVYEGDGWVIHVAGRRRKRSPIPEIPLHRLPTFGAKHDPASRSIAYPSPLHKLAHMAMIRVWMLSHRLSMWHLSHIPFVPIGGQYDGETFVEDSAYDCWERLCALRMAGYHVPQFALDQLLSESGPR